MKIEVVMFVISVILFLISTLVIYVNFVQCNCYIVFAFSGKNS